MSPLTCAQFEEQLEELAIGDLAEPQRSALLAHAASCRDCRGRLDDLLELTDSLLLLAPQHEPPPGFESRVLERLAVGRVSRPSRVRRWWLEAAAAVVLVAIVLGGVALLGNGNEDGDAGAAGTVVGSGVIVNGDGVRTGSVQLVDAEHPYALITIDRPRNRGGEVTCELQLADGTSVVVGSWGYADVRGNVWAAGIDEELLDAVSMRIVGEDGNVLATATLD